MPPQAYIQYHNLKRDPDFWSVIRAFSAPRFDASVVGWNPRRGVIFKRLLKTIGIPTHIGIGIR